MMHHAAFASGFRPWMLVKGLLSWVMDLPLPVFAAGYCTRWVLNRLVEA